MGGFTLKLSKFKCQSNHAKKGESRYCLQKERAKCELYILFTLRNTTLFASFLHFPSHLNSSLILYSNRFRIRWFRRAIQLTQKGNFKHQEASCYSYIITKQELVIWKTCTNIKDIRERTRNVLWTTVPHQRFELVLFSLPRLHIWGMPPSSVMLNTLHCGWKKKKIIKIQKIKIQWGPDYPHHTQARFHTARSALSEYVLPSVPKKQTPNAK